MDISHKQGLTHTGRHAHSGYCHAGSDAEAYVPCKIDIGKRIDQEGIVVLNEELYWLDLDAVKIFTGDALCNGVKELIIRNALQILGYRPLKADAAHSDLNKIMNEFFSYLVITNDLGEHILDVNNINAVAAQNARKHIVFFACASDIGRILCEHTFEIIRHKVGKLNARTMKHDPSESSDL